jgi:hypothetical protein
LTMESGERSPTVAALAECPGDAVAIAESVQVDQAIVIVRYFGHYARRGDSPRGQRRGRTALRRFSGTGPRRRPPLHRDGPRRRHDSGRVRSVLGERCEHPDVGSRGLGAGCRWRLCRSHLERDGLTGHPIVRVDRRNTRQRRQRPRTGRIARVGTVDLHLAAELRDQLGLERAVETGTFRGKTARGLATVFPSVVTIELSEEMHRTAQVALRDEPRIIALQGHSAKRLGELTEPATPTLFYLDGHWSGGDTGGVEDECPVLAELEAMTGGSSNDCVIVDDARLFTSSPPPPHRAEQWPTMLEVIDALRAGYPDHLVTLLNDQVIAVPGSARPAINRYGVRLQPVPGVLDHARGAVARVARVAGSRLGRLRSH